MTAQTRTMWGSQGGRAALLIIMSVLWPVLLISFAMYMAAELAEQFAEWRER